VTSAVQFSQCDSAQNSAKNRIELVESPQSLRQVVSVAISRIDAIVLDV